MERFISIEAARACDWPSPLILQGNNTDTIQFSLEAMFPRSGVYELSGARVTTPHGWVFTDKNDWLVDCSWYGRRQYLPPDVSISSEAEIRLDGRSLVLASDWASSNYSHFVYDVLPRVDLIERSGWAFDDFDHILAPTNSDFSRSLLQRLGIPLERVRWNSYHHSYRCDDLVAPSFPGLRRSLPKWAAMFLRNRLGSGERTDIANKSERRRLYIPRRSTRKLVNESELIERLLVRGFSIYDPGTDTEDQISVFSQAEIVLGAHGAGLTNIVFSPKGALLLEIIPTDHVWPYYFCAAVSSGLRYIGVVAQSVAHLGPRTHGPSPFDIEAPIGIIESAIDMLL